jgi:hypothetical protein
VFNKPSGLGQSFDHSGRIGDPLLGEQSLETGAVLNRTTFPLDQHIDDQPLPPGGIVHSLEPLVVK